MKGGRRCRCWPYGRADRLRRYSVLPISFRKASLSVRRCSFLVSLSYGSQIVSRGAPSQEGVPVKEGGSRFEATTVTRYQDVSSTL
jgi:hypothetical protein